MYVKYIHVYFWNQQLLRNWWVWRGHNPKVVHLNHILEVMSMHLMWDITCIALHSTDIERHHLAIPWVLTPLLGRCYTTYFDVSIVLLTSRKRNDKETWQNIYVALNIPQLQICKSALHKHSHNKQATVCEWARVLSYCLGGKCKNV
jgi:hypothetical protein